MYNDRNDQGGAQGSSGPKQMFTGNWTCGLCGNPITELPFEPDPARLSTLKCRDCHRKAVAERGGGGYRGGNGGGNTGGYRRF